MKFFFLIVLFIYSVNSDELTDFLYKDLSKIKKVNKPSIIFDGSAKSLLEKSEAELKEYAGLVIKRNLPKIKFIGQEDSYSNDFGRLIFTIWAVGESYPIALHVEISAGPYEQINCYERASMRVSSEEMIKNHIKEAFNTLIEDFAITYLKVSGEM